MCIRDRDAAVRGLQGVFLPPADGIVGPDTWHALVVPLFDLSLIHI